VLEKRGPMRQGFQPLVRTGEPMNPESSWERWKALAARAATFQARVLLTVFYWVVVTPFALVLRAFSDPLEIRDPNGGRWGRPPLFDPRQQH